MISENLICLRKQFNMTQEEAAEKIGVSRQALAKWEKGESVPDMYNCISLAQLYKVSIDDLINYSSADQGMPISSQGKHYFGTAVIDNNTCKKCGYRFGSAGKFCPKCGSKLFGMKAGTEVMILGDEDRGIAIVPKNDMMDFINAVNNHVPDNL